MSKAAEPKGLNLSLDALIQTEHTKKRPFEDSHYGFGDGGGFKHKKQAGLANVGAGGRGGRHAGGAFQGGRGGGRTGGPNKPRESVFNRLTVVDEAAGTQAGPAANSTKANRPTASVGGAKQQPQTKPFSGPSQQKPAASLQQPAAGRGAGRGPAAQTGTGRGSTPAGTGRGNNGTTGPGRGNSIAAGAGRGSNAATPAGRGGTVAAGRGSSVVGGRGTTAPAGRGSFGSGRGGATGGRGNMSFPPHQQQYPHQMQMQGAQVQQAALLQQQFLAQQQLLAQQQQLLMQQAQIQQLKQQQQHLQQQRQQEQQQLEQLKQQQKQQSTAAVTGTGAGQAARREREDRDSQQAGSQPTWGATQARSNSARNQAGYTAPVGPSQEERAHKRARGTSGQSSKLPKDLEDLTPVIPTKDTTEYKKHQLCTMDDATGDVVVKLYGQDLVRVKPNGEVILDTGGIHTPATFNTLVETLSLLGVRIVSNLPDVKHFNWSLSDGRSLSRFYDGVTLPAKGQTTATRGKIIMQAFQHPNADIVLAATAASTAAAMRAGIFPTSTHTTTGERGGGSGSAYRSSRHAQYDDDDDDGYDDEDGEQDEDDFGLEYGGNQNNGNVGGSSYGGNVGSAGYGVTAYDADQVRRLKAQGRWQGGMY